MPVFWEPTGEQFIACAYDPELDAIGGVCIEPHELPAYTRIEAGLSHSTVLPDFDFETYSEAGYWYDEQAEKWRFIEGVPKGTRNGLEAVGAAAYSEHPSTELLSLAYNLKDGKGERLWIPGMPPPQELFNHIANGQLLEAWNSAFEWYIWNNVCTRMGWPPLPYDQLRDAMAKSRAFSLPGKLGEADKALGITNGKIEDGTRLLNKFSKPRQPTKHDKRLRLDPRKDPVDGPKLYEYNIRDIHAESAVSAECPDLSPTELNLWLLDQKINFRGVNINQKALADCKAIVQQAHVRYTEELAEITGGAVQSASEVQKIGGWLAGRGVQIPNLQAETIEDWLDNWTDGPEDARRVLEIRSSLGAASVKKLYAIDRRMSRDGRLKDLFAFCGADRTGRFSGRGPQPQNLPGSGPKVKQCDEINGCGHHYGAHLDTCPWCNAPGWAAETVEWSVDAVEDALQVIATRSLEQVERFFGDAIAAVSGCLRGLFSAGPGKDLLCSDYSAIEAVVLAALAGEEWRLEVFRTHGKIYEMSAAKITGVPLQEMLDHKERTGEHHPYRKKIGKVAELGSGFGGSVGAWKNFGAADHFDSDEEIKRNVDAWRDASPNIVNFWHGLERAAKAAVQNPGQCYAYRGITYGMRGDVLYCQLLSGRKLCYHEPRLLPDVTPWGSETTRLTYMGWNSDYKKGPKGWMRLDTYGGKLAENVTQATARDILTHAMPKAEAAGYPIVLHVHDEIVTEVPEGTGSVDQLEAIMADLPDWCRDWPISAAGGWRGKRYRKD